MSQPQSSDNNKNCYWFWIIGDQMGGTLGVGIELYEQQLENEHRIGVDDFYVHGPRHRWF